MMTQDEAARILYLRAAWLIRKITAWEDANGIMSAHYRAEVGAIRVALTAFGWQKDVLPEAPHLNPAHLDAYHARRLSRKTA